MTNTPDILKFREEMMGFDMNEVLSNRLNILSRDISGVEVKVPQSYDEAMTAEFREDYIDGIRDEVLSHLTSQSFFPVFHDTLPSNCSPVDSRWVFDIKRNVDGSIKKYKARLVIRGFMQQEGDSYFKTFSPTVSKDSIRILLAIAAMYGLPTRQLDFKTAFLNGVLPENEVIYCKVPQGFDLDNLYQKYFDPNEVQKYKNTRRLMYLRLNKSIYGTKQASRTWYLMLKNAMEKFGYKCLQCDPSLYVLREDKKFTLIAIFVDDVLAIATDNLRLDELVTKLSTKFNITDMGEVHQILGMTVNRSDDGNLLLNNPVYIDQVIRHYGMDDCNVKLTPAAAGSYLCANESDEPIDPLFHHDFRALIGSLMFAAINWRPDIMFRVTHLARFASKPSQAHMEAAKYILRYLKGTKNLGLIFRRDDRLSADDVRPTLVAWTDSNHAADKDRVSVSGHMLQIIHQPYYTSTNIMNDVEREGLPRYNVITYTSKRQREIALSSTEAEYIASASCCKTIMHLKQLMCEMGFESCNNTLTMFVDNQSIIALANDLKVSSRFKHVQIRHHYIRWNVMSGEVRMVYIATNLNVADFFTKPNPGPAFLLHRSMMMNEED